MRQLQTVMAAHTQDVYDTWMKRESDLVQARCCAMAYLRLPLHLRQLAVENAACLKGCNGTQLVCPCAPGISLPVRMSISWRTWPNAAGVHGHMQLDVICVHARATSADVGKCAADHCRGLHRELRR